MRALNLCELSQRFGLVVSFVLLTARLWSAQPNAAVGWELDAIAAPVLGGVSLFGGVGSIGGTIVGAFIILLTKRRR